MIPARAQVLEFVERVYPAATLETLAGDASTRRFLRLQLPQGASQIVMDYGAPFDGETDDVILTRVFRKAGLPVPAILRIEPAVGLLLLEDLGDRTLEQALNDSRLDPLPLLEQAVDLAASIADRGSEVLATSVRAGGPALDQDRFRFEMNFFIEHYAMGLRGIKDVPGELVDELHALADRAADCPAQVLCHRDFHSRNLMVRQDGSLAMVDIQDARWGPDSYDLASLVYDAYVGVEPSWIPALVDRYLGARLVPPERAGFEGRLSTVAAQRMLKALGTFGFQAGVRGNQRYLGGVPRTLERLSRLLGSDRRLINLGEVLRRVRLLD